MKDYITQSRKKTRTKYIFFLTSVFLAVLVNVFSSALLEEKIVNSKMILIISGSLILIILICIIYNTIKHKIFRYVLKGFVSYDLETKKLIPLLHYGYSEKLSRVLDSSFKENIALKTLWENEPINEMIQFDQEKKIITRKNQAGGKLLVEATEYYFLEKLSTHLNDYFNKRNLKTKTLNREDVSNIVVTNRFLDLLSRNMNERTVFSDMHKNETEQGTIVYAMGKEGAFFSSFDLTLPKGSKIFRDNNGQLVIKTNRFKMQVKVLFDGYGVNTPRLFDKIIKKGSFKTTRDYQVKIKVRVVFYPFSFIFPFGCKYYSWLESFIKKIDKDFSSKKYFRKIAWNKNMIVLDELCKNS